MTNIDPNRREYSWARNFGRDFQLVDQLEPEQPCTVADEQLGDRVQREVVRLELGGRRPSERDGRTIHLCRQPEACLPPKDRALGVSTRSSCPGVQGGEVPTHQHAGPRWIERARKYQSGPVGRVVALDERAHFGDGEAAQGWAGPIGGVMIRMAGRIYGLIQHLPQVSERHVFEAPHVVFVNLSHLLRDARVGQCLGQEPHLIAPEPQRQRDGVRRHGRREERMVEARMPLPVPAHPLQQPDVFGGTDVLGLAQHQGLDDGRQARPLLGLVTDPNLVGQLHPYHRRLEIGRQDHCHAVRQHELLAPA
jgi:hypothetical protein